MTRPEGSSGFLPEAGVNEALHKALRDQIGLDGKMQLNILRAFSGYVNQLKLAIEANKKRDLEDRSQEM